MLKNRKERGFILPTVILFIAIITLIAFTLSYRLISTTKLSGISKSGTVYFYGAEGGCLSAAAYMTQYRVTVAPSNVLTDATSLFPGTFSVNIYPLASTVRPPIGFSTLWTGSDIRENCVSLPQPSNSQVEVLVFVPIAPAAYMNE